MANLEDLKRMLAQYSKTYRHPDRPEFTVTIPFDLFPERGTSNPKELTWPSKWPAAENPGVYAMLDEKYSVLYVGKTSLGNTLGRRSSSTERAPDFSRPGFIFPLTRLPRISILPMDIL